MPTVYALFSDPIAVVLNDTGDPASGWQVFIYEAGSETKVTTYRDSDGAVANTNPIILNSRGVPPHGIYVENGTYKYVLAKDTDTDPPAAAVETRDDISPFAAPGTTVTEWVDPALAPTYISATQFTLAGDQTAEFHVGRRLRITDTGGIEYPTISASSFAASVTTITVADATLDSGLSKVEYSILSGDNSALPWMLSDSGGLTMGSGAALTLAMDPESALDAVALRMLGSGVVWGLELSNNATDPDHDVDIAVGAAVDTTLAYGLALTSAFVKEIDAAWAAGTAAGGLFTGTVAASTWYHVFLIRKDSDGSLDAGFDASVTAANIPAGYTAYCRLGSVVTDASSNVVPFHQVKDMVYWKSPALDLDQAISSTATDYALDAANQGCPPDVSCEVWANIYSSAAGLSYIRSPLSGFADLTPSNSAAPLATIEGTDEVFAGPFLTSTAKELNFRSTGTPNIRMSVVAYRDPR